MGNVKHFKKVIIFLMAVVIAFSTVPATAATTYKSGSKTITYKGSSYKVYYNSKLASTVKKPAVMINSNVMIPYKPSLVKRGPRLPFTYNKAKKTLKLTYNGKTIKFVVNKKYIWINGVKNKIRTAPLFVKFSGTNTLMIPAKAFCSAIGLEYVYKKNQKAVYITASSPTTNSSATTSQSTSTLTATAFANMTTSQFIATMGPIAREDYKKTGVLASVTLAQAILESGWGKSALAQSANNMFGMKTSLSGNDWAGSTWDGVSCVNIKTGEEYNGKNVTITAAFRKYPCVAQSVADHSAYLVNAKNGLKKRYAGLTATNSYEKQLSIIKEGGYATSSTYVSYLTSLIKKYNLTQYDY